MSLGYGGVCELIEQNDSTITYAYGPYNLNKPGYENREHLYDGRIIIQRTALVEPEIHHKRKRKPNGKKVLLEKRVRKDVDYSVLLADRKIIIQNSSLCWRIYPSGHGMIALRLIFRIFDSYQDTGELPDRVGYNV